METLRNGVTCRRFTVERREPARRELFADPVAANVLAVARAVVEETGVDPAEIAGDKSCDLSDFFDDASWKMGCSARVPYFTTSGR